MRRTPRPGRRARGTRTFLAAIALATTASVAAHAATCRDPAGFEKWLGDVGREAIEQGIAPAAVAAGLAGLTFDPSIIRHDRGQRFFRQSFEQFSAKMVPAYRVQKGRALVARLADLLAQIEARYGVPGEVIVAIWGLEGDFGAASTGTLPVMRSLATLAYDCRRTDLFTENLFDALRIIERGDLTPAQMRGAWAGELGQAQFMARNYYHYAVDFDGDGRRDLFRSTPDVLASVANYLKEHGWQRGAGYEPGEPNFEVLKTWNKSDVYVRTIALLAGRIAR